MDKSAKNSNRLAMRAITVYQKRKGADLTMLKRKAAACRPSSPCLKLGKTVFQREML
jgi:hypothetical protein